MKNPRATGFGLFLVLNAIALLAAAPAGARDVMLPSAQTVTLSQSQSIARSLYGLSLPLALRTNRLALGEGRIIGGVDTVGIGAAQAVSTGLEWRFPAPGLDSLEFTGLQTGTEGAGLEGSQFLGRMLARIALGDVWLAPALGIEASVLRGQQEGRALDGNAFGVSIDGPVARGSYQVRLRRTDPQFRPLGALVPAGRTVMQAGVKYPVSAAYSLDTQVGLHRESLGADPLTVVSSELNLEDAAGETRRFIDTMGWRIGSYARRAASGRLDERALDLSTIATLALGSRWRLSNALAWHSGFDPLIRAAPVDEYYAWRLIGERYLGGGVYRGVLRPSMSFRRSLKALSGWGFKAGLELQVARFAQHFSMHFNYVSDSLRPTLAPAQAGLQLLFQLKVDAGDARRLFAGR